MVTHLHIGGLIAVGFDPNEEHLLAVSHSGRGVFSTKTWERVARDPRPCYPENGIVTGIGPVEGLTIRVTEFSWESCGELTIASPSGRIELLCESSGITVLASP